MTFDHLLAVVAVRDLQAGREWYSALLGRQPDNDPMPTLSEWQVVPRGWLQVFEDPERAGSSLFNLAVDDLDAHITALRDQGLHPEDLVEAAKGVRLSTLTDPDGNTIRLIGGFRVQY